MASEENTASENLKIDDGNMTLMDLVARQKVLLENIIICEQMLVQLRRIQALLKENITMETEHKIAEEKDQTKS